MTTEEKLLGIINFPSVQFGSHVYYYTPVALSNIKVGDYISWSRRFGMETEKPYTQPWKVLKKAKGVLSMIYTGVLGEDKVWHIDTASGLFWKGRFSAKLDREYVNTVWKYVGME